MCITTKSRYGLRFLVYLTRNKGRKVPLREFAENENLPVKYLEQIIRPLINVNIIKGVMWIKRHLDKSHKNRGKISF